MHSLSKVITFIFGFAGVISLAWQFSDVFGFWRAVALFVLIAACLYLLMKSQFLQAAIFCTRTFHRVEFKDDQGAVVTVQKEQIFYPVWDHITRITDTIGFDGRLDGFSAEVKSQPSSWHVMQKRPNSQVIAHEFHRPLAPLCRQTRTVQYTYYDSFTSAHEFFEIDVLYPGYCLCVELRFPKGRPPRNTVAFRVVGSISLASNEVSVSNEPSGFAVAEFTAHWLVPGQRYRIEWDW